jgi:hypothetical protein
MERLVLICLRPLVSTAVSTCVCAFAHAAEPAKDYSKEIAFAKRALERGLKDPSSVQYRDIRVVTKKTGTRTICGEFNAKNSFGGYVGFQSFAAEVAVPLPQVDLDMETWKRLCLTDAEEAAVNGPREAMRKQRREMIEQTCAEKRQAIQAEGVEVDYRLTQLEHECADASRSSDNH